MSRKKSPTRKETNIKVGNISGVNGTMNIAGGDITTHQTTTGLSAAEIKGLFEQLYAKIDARPEVLVADKEDLKAEVKEIQSTITEAAKKNEKVDEEFLSRRFRNIARIAPDILEVVVATLVNPALGISVAVKKIADKAKEETKQS